MKKRFNWIAILIAGLLLLSLAACDQLGQVADEIEEAVETAEQALEAVPEQQPAEEEAAAPAEVPAEEAAGEVVEEQPAGEEAYPAPVESAYPGEGEADPETAPPEISQPIYSWGEVADRLWVLVGYGDALNPTVVEEGLLISAVFSSSDGSVAGSGGCNNYFTSYQSTDDGGLNIDDPAGMTMMACPEGMEAETAYMAALTSVTGWASNEQGNLVLAYDSGQPYDETLIFVPGDTPLTGPIWRLVSFGDPEDLSELEEGTAITAKFETETDTSGIVGGSAGCNNYNGSYGLDGENISFGPLATTRMACARGMEQEGMYLAALSSAQTYQIVGPNMQINYDGGVLNYTSLNLPLENVLWEAVMVVGQPVPEEIDMTALFVAGDESGIGSVGGNTGCNNFNTSYETSSDISTNPPTNYITVSSPMAMTMAMCPGEELAELERAFLGALETAETFEILGDQLVLEGPNGNIQFAANRAPLLGTYWTLASLGSVDNPQPPVEGSNFTAQFNRLPTLPSGTVSGETGCNDYNATFAADLTNIKINLPTKSNNEECPWGTGNYEVEQQYFLGLNAATTYSIIGNTLVLPYGEGEDQQALTFVASQPPVDEVLDLTPLNDTFWYLSSLGDTPILSGTEITAGFVINEDGVTGEISGSAGCNGYNGAIGENFVMGPFATTRKACPAPVMDQEAAYLAWLETAAGYVRSGDQLVIQTANGVLTYNSEPVLDQAHELQNSTWYLLSYGSIEIFPGSYPTAIFAADAKSLSGWTTCNEYTGAYKAEQGNKLTISDLASTKMACPSDQLSQQEENFRIWMVSAVSYAVSGSQLQIRTKDGGVMNFTSIPPAEPVGPTAVIAGETLAETGQTLTFDGSQSRAGTTPIVRYDWDMGDGALLNGAIVNYSYNQPGSFTVSLTVTDQLGQQNTTTQAVQITPVVEPVVPPTAAIEGPSSALVGAQVTFSAAGSQQGTAAITSYEWVSGDGNGTGQVPTNSFNTIYSSPGTYYPSVTVRDEGGLSDSASMAIVVSASLAGTDWTLSNTIPGTSISLTFGNGNISGFAGCNSYNANYSTNGSNISVGPISSSKALCTEQIMQQEQAYLQSLQTASSYAINGNTLTLTTASGPLTFYASVATIQPVPLPAAP